MESVGIIEGSMTPPVSPHCMDNWYDDPIDDSLLLQQDEATIETEPSYLFIDCTDGHTSYNIENKATCATRQHQVLTRILSCQDPYPNQFQDTKVKLFGSHFVASTCLLDSKSLIFSLAKQTLGKLKLYLEKISHRALKESDTSDSSRLRHTCIVFLQYLKIYIHRHYKYDENSQCRHNQRLSGLSTALLFEIQGLSMYLGKMTDLPSSIFSQYISSSLKKQSIGHLFLHLILNVRWGLIEVLHLLYNKTKGFATENDVNNLLTTEVNILIDDLIDVARGRFKSISRRSYKNSSPFSCSCLQEFVILLIQFLDQRYDKFETDAFWVMLHKAFKKKVSLDEKGNVELYWWLIMHIAPLYNQNGGLIKDKSDIKSNWTVVGELLKLMFSQELSFDEESIRVQLQCCLSLCHVWQPDTKILASLWQYSHKRMNQSLLKTERYLDGLASLSKSAIGWFDQCKQRATDHTASQDSENSFHLFLRIIAAQFGKLEGSDKLQGWRQIKGRLYSKFHSRSMQELNSNGLSQFISLFLILAQKVDLTDVSHKMVDLLDMLLMDSSLSRSKQQIIYKGLFTLCLVLQERQVDMSFVADKLSSGFDTICRELSQTDMDIGERHQIWTLITLYTDSTQDVFDNSSDNLSLSEEKLIGSGFKHLLPACNESEIRVMLQFTLNLMACQRSVYKRMYRSEGKHVPKAKIKDLIQRLWNNFYSFVKSSSSNSKPNCLLADVAASFTMLASDMEDNLTEPQEKMLDIFNYFGVADTSVHFSISLRYLCHLLPNTALMQKVEKHYGEAYQPTLIHAWVRCSILTNQNADELQEFTRLIYKLPAMTTILGNRAQLPDTNEPEFSQFVRCLGQRFASAKNLQEKIQFRKETLQLFGDLVKLIQFSLKKSSAAEAELKWLYRAIGYIVRDCAPVLYVQSKPHQSQLPGLISELLLPPLIFNPNKTLPTNMLSAIRDTLNLFLEGLSTLDFHKDGFIRQKMQEIVQQYFIRFAIKSSLMPNSNSVTANHPLLVTLYPSQRHNPTPHMRKLRQFVIEVLRSRFIALKGQQAPSQAANALQFVHELFTRTSLANETAKNAAPLLDTILNYLLMCDNGGLKRQASQILVIMMQACKSSADKNINKDLSSILQKFVDRNLQVHQSSTFQVLESVAALYPLPMYDMIPYLNELLAKCEMKRGAGTDNRIRRTYKSLLGHLGSGGEVVIQQIEQGREVLEY